MKVCAVRSCGREVHCRSLCWRHYIKGLRNGLVKKQPLVNKGKMCSVPGCTTKAYQKSWCSKHYRRWRLTGKTGPFWNIPHRSKLVGHPCRVAGCGERIQRSGAAKGFCRMHYAQIRTHGHVVSVKRRRAPWKRQAQAPASAE